MKSSIFTDRYLPHKPFAAEEIRNGVYRYPKEKALEKRYIETQPKDIKNFLIFDIDIENADWHLKSLMWDDNSIPEPNVIINNPNTTHSQVIYFLDGVITTSKAESYYNHIRTRFQPIIGGDPAYSGRIMRNPLRHNSEYITDKEYTLQDIKLFIPDHLPIIETEIKEISSGRNDAMFTSLRTFGYSAYRKSDFNNSTIYKIIETQAYFLNESSFDNPLSQSELNSIIKSTYKWITTRHSKGQFSKIQSNRAQKRWGDSKEIKQKITLSLKADGKSFIEIGRILSITPGAAKTTYYRALKQQQMLTK